MQVGGGVGGAVDVNTCSANNRGYYSHSAIRAECSDIFITAV